MILEIGSNLPTFKTLQFKKGLNIVMARKRNESTDRQSRNGAGKSSIIEIISFLFGADVDKSPLFSKPTLSSHEFYLSLLHRNAEYTIKRSPETKNAITFLKPVLVEQNEDVSPQTVSSKEDLTLPQWKEKLGQWFFGLQEVESTTKAPSFRSLLGYFLRREASKAFESPTKSADMQTIADEQRSILFLLGFDWQIAVDWETIRTQEGQVKNLKKLSKSGALQSLTGAPSEIRSKLISEENKLAILQKNASEFKVLPEYHMFEQEADRLTARLSDLSSLVMVENVKLKNIELAIRDEVPPIVDYLEKIYEEAGIVLPETTLKRYEDVLKFHESVIRNRQNYLNAEFSAVKNTIGQAEKERSRLAEEKGKILELLESHQAIEQLKQINAQIEKQSNKVAILKQKLALVEEAANLESTLKIRREELVIRLRNHLNEFYAEVARASSIYENIASRLFDYSGKMIIETTNNGPNFRFDFQGKGSIGIGKMSIFCFDLMLMKICKEREMGIEFLIHDSQLFDGVDGRQILQALKVAAEIASELDFQYIVTMNEDDLFKEQIEGFDPTPFIHPTIITDDPDGGLFGIRF